MAISTNGTVLTRLAGALYNTQMSNATYKEVAALDPTALANVLYARDFNTVSDATVAATLVTNLGLTSVAGLTNWVAAQLTAAGSAKGAKVVDLLNGFAQLTADATYGVAATAFNNKVDSALALSQATDNTGGTFDSISTVVSGKIFTLTTGVDSLTATSGNDSFSAPLVSSVQSLNGLDKLDGGAGTDDSLSAILNSGSVVIPAKIANIESITVSSTASSSGISLLNATGVKSAEIASSSTTGSITGISATDVSLKATGNSAAATFTINNAALSGSTDVVSLTVSGQNADVTVNSDGTNSIETLSLAAVGGASTIGNLLVSNSTNSTTATKLTVSGSGNVTIGSGTALGATITSIDASASTGAVSIATAQGAPTIVGGGGNDTFTFSAAGNVSVNGGAGNDAFVFDNTATITSSDTVTGGDGTDTIKSTISGASSVSSSLSKVTGIEKLTITDTYGTAGTASSSSLSSTYFGSGVSTIQFEAAINTSGTITVNAGASTIALVGNASTEIIGDSGADSTLTLAVDGTGVADSLTLDVSKGGANGAGPGFSFTDHASAASSQYQVAISVTGAETFNLVTGTTQSQSNASSVALTQEYISDVTLTGTGGTATTLKISGGLGVAMGDATQTAAINASVIDASALTIGNTTSGLTMTVASTLNTAQSITGSPGADALIGGTGNDTISGGSGNDTITSGAGNDSLSGGDGNDTFTLAANFATGDVIDGGDGTSDTISIDTTSISTLNGYTISAANALNDKISGIERLTVTGSNSNSLDLARVDSVNYVTVSGANTATLSGFGASGTLVLSGANSNTVTASLTDATGDSDKFNLTVSHSSGNNFGTVTVGSTSAVVETVNVTTSEGSAPTSSVIAHTLALGSAGNKTVNILGAEALTLTLNSTSISTIDASALTAGYASVTATSTLSNVTATGSAGADTFSTGSGNDSVSAGFGDDSLTGGAGNDTLDGGAGNDTVVAGTGVDSLIGGDGTDTLAATGITTSDYDGGAALITGVAINIGASTIAASTINSAAGYVSSDITALSPGQLLRLSGTAGQTSTRISTISSFDNVTGSGGADYIVGSSSANVINGGDGNDTIIGGSGTDTVLFGASSGADTIYLGAASTVYASGTDGSADIVKFNFATAASMTATSNVKTIYGFESGSDVIQFVTGVFVGSAGTTVAAGTGAFANVATNANFAVTNQAFFQLTGTADLNATSAANVTTVAAYLAGTVNATEKVLFAIDDGTDTYLWYFNGAAGTATNAATADITELSLIGIVKGVNSLVSGDFSIVAAVS